MDYLNAESVFAVVIVVSLLGLAGYFAWQQWRTLRRLPGQTDLSTEERRFQWAQCWRRLLGSVVMVVLAGLLVGSYWVGQEHQAALMMDQPNAAAAHGDRDQLDPAQQQFLTQYSTFWIIFGVLLLGLVFLAFLDVWAIRRFARQQFHRIRTERRAMIEREVAQLRRERNGF